MPLSAQLAQQIANSSNDPRFYLFNDFPQSPDETLLYLLGGDIDRYDLVLKDAKAKALLEKRSRNVVMREWDIKPATDSKLDKKAADIFKEVISRFDSDLMIDNILTNAYLKGNNFEELQWAIDGDLTYIKKATSKPIHRFRFARPGANTSGMIDQDGTTVRPIKNKEPVGMYQDYEVRVLSMNDTWQGANVPDKRVLVHSYGQRYDNPWGVGLGSVLYWLAVIFKKEITKQRLIYLDKYANPTVRVIAGEKATREQRENVAQQLADMIKGGSLVLPHGWLSDFMEAMRSSTNDVFQGATDWCNNEMAMLVVGETLSMELPDNTGSRAATQSHSDESNVYLAKYDSDRLCTGPMRTLAQWITELNTPGANPPQVWKRFPEFEESEDLNSRVNRDNTLNTIGYKISPDKVKEVYGEGYIDSAAAEVEQQKQQEDSGAFDVGFGEEVGEQGSRGAGENDSNPSSAPSPLCPSASYAERKAIAFQKRLQQWRKTA
ncbi:DUF935 family protein [Aulosira sp. FACHB-615]|uniref:phage portal protein family protein n=1 Tax=Aulosira sp. FACHB-615 TaxID=2692777 RepID=UPI00168508A1|nr:DUF935 family protein [Aulosira sp. FACHB-615]MBD2492536.1 DUF935 family protein [Aulosira sp. FACHB-615]